MNWKFWTWPAQIRQLTAKLETAQDVIDRQRKYLEVQAAQIERLMDARDIEIVRREHAEKHSRAAHRAHL